MHPEPLNPTGDARVGATGDAPVEPTGDDRVDAAIAGLAALDELELADHPKVLEAVHDRLRDILGELGDAGRPTHSGQAHGGQVHIGQTHSGQTLGGQAHGGQAHSGPGGDPRP